jgi:hypothetical protein
MLALHARGITPPDLQMKVSGSRVKFWNGWGPATVLASVYLKKGKVAEVYVADARNLQPPGECGTEPWPIHEHVDVDY